MMEDKIGQDYIHAMKSRDSVRSSTLSFLRSQLKYVKIEKKTEKLEDSDVTVVIKKQIKQRQDSIEQYAKGGRQDLVDKETAEMNILKSYLPEEISEDQLKAIIQEAVKESAAVSIKDMGKVMKAILAKTAGRADSKLISDMVKSALAGM